MTIWDQFGTTYDYDNFEDRPRTYIIASMPRSGSHYLSHLLWETGALGSPLEYLHPGHISTWMEKLNKTSLTDVILALFKLRTSPTGWWGVKAHWPQFAAIAQDEALLQILSFQKFIRIDRRDKLDQAISLVLARQTAAWISFHQQLNEPQYDFDQILMALSELDLQSKQWDRFFADGREVPLVVEYEAFVEKPTEKIDLILSKFQQQRIQRKAATFRPQRQASDVNLKWKELYLRHLDSRHF